MEMGLVMSQHFLENFSKKNSGVEFWWDSSPLIFDDWKENFDELKDICKVVYLERTKGISTSNLRENTINRF